MMKISFRLSALLLALVLTLTLVACGRTDDTTDPSSPIPSTGEPSASPTDPDPSSAPGTLPTTGDVSTDHQISVSDKVPVITLPGEFVQNDISGVETDGYEILGAYSSPDPAEVAAVVFYKYAANGLSLQEAAQQAVLEECGEMAEDIAPVECTSWVTENDFHYFYFIYYDPTFYLQPAFVQVYLFADGDDIYEINYVLTTQQLTLPDTSFSFRLPVYMTAETDWPAGLTEKGLLASYVNAEDSLDEFSNLRIFSWQSEDGKTVQDEEDWYRDNYDQVEITEYEYSDGETTYTCFVATFEETDADGMVTSNYAYVFSVDDVYFEFDFWQWRDTDMRDYQAASVPAMLWTVGEEL